jgi:dihydropteroate synthase
MSTAGQSWSDWLAAAGRPLVMGVVNVTPDSFSDGGRFLDACAAIEHAGRLVADGADLLDVGGESTRPGAEPVDAAEQRRRVVPVIEGLREAGLATPIFVDTRRADVAAAALDAGATGVNDVSALRDDPAMAALLARRNAPVVLMHMLGTPATMHRNPAYQDVVGEVAAFLRERVRFAVASGIGRDRIAIDPGIGFGKTVSHNLELLRRTDALAGMGLPVLVGPSRKRFIGEILGIDRPAERDVGTLAAVAAAVLGGADVVRVHEVAMTSQVVRVAWAIRGGLRGPVAGPCVRAP